MLRVLRQQASVIVLPGPVVLKVGGIALVVAILRGKGAKKTKGAIGGTKQHQWGGNAQPLIDY